MDEAVEAVDLGGYSGVGRRLGVGLGFVAGGVGLDGQDERRAQAGQVGGHTGVAQGESALAESPR